MSGTLFIIAAASGTGKTSLVKALCKQVKNLKVSVSCTTRPERPGEKDGTDYYFVDETTFTGMVAKGAFLEHETVFDYHYGTPRQWVEEQLALGNDVVLEIDWQGARDVRAILPEKVIGIFILPPAVATLEQRLRDREQDDEGTIRRRMRDALEEISHYAEFDYLVINDEFENTVAELAKIIESRRKGRVYKGPDLKHFVEELMTEGGNIK